MVKIFVSGKFFDKTVIHSFMSTFINLGHEITYDWTVHEMDDITCEKLQQAAISDINGVKACEIHIIIITDPEYVYRGTFAELGCSLGLGKRVMIFCPFDSGVFMRVPFYHHPLIEYYKDFNKLLENI